MEYTVQRLARLAGISPRTLRYYDQLGLLRPCRISQSGYRIYGPKEVALLQQILLYRALELPLEQIRSIVHAPDFDPLTALCAHRDALTARRMQIDALLTNVDATISHMKGMILMSDKQRFDAFRQQIIADNEAQHGQEARARHGDAAIDVSNQRLRGMSQSAFEAGEKLANEVNDALRKAFAIGDPCSIEAQHTVELHHGWLQHWGDYTPEMHISLGQMYVDDERFTAYYDAIAIGAAVFLRDAINAYYGK